MLREKATVHDTVWKSQSGGQKWAGKREKMVENKPANDGTERLDPPPVDMKQFLPYGFHQYVDFLQEFYDNPQKYSLSDEDPRLYLSDREQAELKASADEIKTWLEKCSKGNAGAYSYSFPHDAMRASQELIKKVAEGKLLWQQRQAALREIAPPLDDAERYLTPPELREFLYSITGAVDAYLDSEEKRRIVPNIWLFDKRAMDYLGWTGIIEGRKEEEAREKHVEMEEIAQNN